MILPEDEEVGNVIYYNICKSNSTDFNLDQYCSDRKVNNIITRIKNQRK